jgi:hypothetical protein
MMTKPVYVAPEDRMPTIDEIRQFDAAAAWDRLTPEQQRQIGLMAVHCAALSVPQSYENDYTADERGEIHSLECDALTLFTQKAEPMLHFMFGWTPNAADIETMEIAA